MDEEAHILSSGWGKNWVSGLLPLVSAKDTPVSSIESLLNLLTTLFRLSAASPTFSRETALPAIPKYSQALVGLLARSETSGNWEVIVSILGHILPS